MGRNHRYPMQFKDGTKSVRLALLLQLPLAWIGPLAREDVSVVGGEDSLHALFCNPCSRTRAMPFGSSIWPFISSSRGRRVW